MKLSELITHLYLLPQDAEVHIVVNQVTGNTAPIKDICYWKPGNQIAFDNWPADGPNGTETLMSYQLDRL